jgi:hypothetical protein
MTGMKFVGCATACLPSMLLFSLYHCFEINNAPPRVQVRLSNEKEVDLLLNMACIK